MDQIAGGADFLLLDPANAPARGLTDWLVNALRSAIDDGRLALGSRLPADPRPCHRPRGLPRSRRRGVPPAHRRGAGRRPQRRRHHRARPTRSRPAAATPTRTAAGRTAAAAASPAADRRRRRPVSWRARPVRVSAQPVAADRARRPDRDAARGARLRRPAGASAVACCPRTVARAHTWTAGRARRPHHRLRCRTGHGAAGATTLPRRHRLHRR